MCYSVLLVRFKNDKAEQQAKCSDMVDEDRKINEYKGKDQVLDIAVFRCQKHVTRTESWDEKPYSPPQAATPATEAKP